MHESEVAVTDALGARTIAFERVVRAPRARVFAAYVDPGNVFKWWGPRGFTTETHSMDVRVGGAWRYTMYGPQGVFPNLMIYREITPPARLAYWHGEAEGDVNGFEALLQFSDTEVDGAPATRIALRFVFPAAAAADAVRPFAAQGAESTLSRLEEYLNQPA